MTTPLSADAASKILVDAFQPLRCVVSPCAETQSLGIGLIDQQGEPFHTEEILAVTEYRDPERLRQHIERLRQELKGKGHELSDWQMPFITDPDALPPPVFN